MSFKIKENLSGIVRATTNKNPSLATQPKAQVGKVYGVVLDDITPNNATSSIKSQPVQGQPTTRPSDSGLNKALNNSQEQNMDYQALEASSSVHSAGKSGWCFVGEDRGFRSCALVNEDDKCMSGDIFPSQELCINPNLRA